MALLAVTFALLVYTLLEPHLAGPARAEDGVAFQRLTGGFGMGAVAAIYWDFATFDPRLATSCNCSLWPLPGGYLYSPEHRGSIWDPPEGWPAASGAAAGGEP